MATPPTLPAGSSAALQNRFNNLANDDERRGFLAYYQTGIFHGFRGANLIRYGWDQLSEEEQQNYIDEALQADEDQADEDQADEDQADEDQADEDQEVVQDDEDQASQHLSLPSSPPEMPTPRAGSTIRIRNRSVLADNEVARESEDVEVQRQGEDNGGLSQGEDYENEPPFEGFSDAQQDEDSEGLPHPENNEGVPIGQMAERVESSLVNSRKRKQQSDDLSLQSEERGTTSYKPSRGTVENTAEAWDEFIRNHPEQVEAMGIHPDWEWVWATTIAASGSDYHKAVMVWVALDENNRVRERLVQKKTQVQKNFTHAQEKEQRVLKKMNFCDNTVRGYWNHVAPDEPDENSNTYTMFMEFCEHGDLSNLLEFYYHELLRDTQIPETFIWLVFFSLAEAIYALNTGVCGAKIGQRLPDGETCLDAYGDPVYYDAEDPPTANGKTRENWSPWAHLDIKPMNIFLGKSAADSKCSAFPRVVLADYDLADEQNNFAKIAQHMGTPGYRPPELRHPHKFDRIKDESSDIYSTGLTIWSLMYSGLGAANDKIRFANEKVAQRFAEGDTFPSTRLPGSKAMYSQNLHDLVNACLKLEQRSRIGFIELRKRAAEGLEESIEMWGSATKDGYEQRMPLFGVMGAPRFRLGGEWDRKRRKVMDSE